MKLQSVTNVTMNFMAYSDQFTTILLGRVASYQPTSSVCFHLIYRIKMPELNINFLTVLSRVRNEIKLDNVCKYVHSITLCCFNYEENGVRCWDSF